MRANSHESYILYKIYLLNCLEQDIDSKIDYPPVSYSEFKKILNDSKKCDIIKKKY